MITARIVFANDGGEVAKVKFSEDTGELEIESDEYTAKFLKKLFQVDKHRRFVGSYPEESGKTDGFRDEIYIGTQSEDHFNDVLEYHMGVSFNAVDIEVTANQGADGLDSV